MYIHLTFVILNIQNCENCLANFEVKIPAYAFDTFICMRQLEDAIHPLLATHKICTYKIQGYEWLI